MTKDTFSVSDWPTIEADLSTLLTSGADSRSILHPKTGLNKYLCAMTPRKNVIPFGSCTASSISPIGFDAASKAHRRILALTSALKNHTFIDELFHEIRSEILSMLTGGLVPGLEIILTPSGTDAELVALSLAMGDFQSKVCNILVAPNEVGGGTPLAAAGSFFDKLTPCGIEKPSGEPVDQRLAESTILKKIWVRDQDGNPRHDPDLDQEVKAIVDEEIQKGHKILLHVVAHSKTGLHAPTLDLASRLCLTHGLTKIVVVIDAAQGRISRRGLIEVLRCGYMVIITGSKFYGGPPFSGALLIPSQLSPGNQGISDFPKNLSYFLTAGQLPYSWESFRQALPSPGNLGLGLRWIAALAEMREYYVIPSEIRLKILRYFELLIPEIFKQSKAIVLSTIPAAIFDNEAARLLESKTTVFSFRIRDLTKPNHFLNFNQLAIIYRWLTLDLNQFFDNESLSLQPSLARGFHLGQPVFLGQGSQEDHAVLRVALGSVLLHQVSHDPSLGENFQDRLSWLRNQVMMLKNKIEFIAQHYDKILEKENVEASQRSSK